MRNFILESGLPHLPGKSFHSCTTASPKASDIVEFIHEQKSFPRFEIHPDIRSPLDQDLISNTKPIALLDGQEVRNNSNFSEEAENVREAIRKSVDIQGYRGKKEEGGLSSPLKFSLSVDCIPKLTGDSMDCVHICMTVDPKGNYTLNGTAEQVVIYFIR